MSEEQKKERDIVEWEPVSFGILKRRYERAVAQGETEFTLPDPVRSVQGNRVTLLTPYARYLIEYLESIGLEAH